MKIEELKNKIEKKDLDDSLIILKTKESSFVVSQYINEISNIRGMELEYVDNVLQLDTSDIFKVFNIQSNSIKVLHTDELEYHSFVPKLKDVIIVCEKIAKDYDEQLITEIPKLEDWQVKDYVYGIGEDIDRKNLDELADIAKYDIFRLDNELAKLNIFDEDKDELYKKFIEDGVFSDLSKYTIFNFTNAVIKKDFNTLKIIYKEMSNVDIEPIGLLTVLITNFRDIITVQLNNNPTPENCNMPKGKFWAIKYSCGYYTKQQLLSIYDFLTDVDRKIKVGDMPMNMLIDYLVLNILDM